MTPPRPGAGSVNEKNAMMRAGTRRPWRRLTTSLLSCGLAGSALAQPVLVVDAAGGPSSQFRDLPPAIAAAPTGAILDVRPGSYSAFVLDKPLRIIGQPGAHVGGGLPAVTIRGVPAGSTAVVSGLVVSAQVEVRGNQGLVLLEELSPEVPLFPGIPRFELLIEDSAQVSVHYRQPISTPWSSITARNSGLLLHRVQATGVAAGGAAQCGSFFFGIPGLTIDGGQAAVVGGVFVGGSSSCLGTFGQPGVQVINARLPLFGTQGDPTPGARSRSDGSRGLRPSAASDRGRCVRRARQSVHGHPTCHRCCAVWRHPRCWSTATARSPT